MLTRIATWSLGAALVLGLVASSEAAPPKPAAKPTAKPAAKNDPWRTDFPALPRGNFRTHPVVKPPEKLPPVATAVYDEGRIERIDDNVLIYSVELPPEARAAMATKKNIPVSQVPDRLEKRALIDYGALTPSLINNRIGQDVQLELRQDPHGFIYVTNFATQKRK